MHNFKKLFASIIGALLVIAIISVVVIVPYMNSEFAYFQDAKLRSELSGTIDCIVIGASHALAGIDPNVLDEKLGYNSYNLSGSMMTLDGRYYLLSKELERNPVKTVVLEISRDSLTRDEGNEFAIGDEPTVGRLDSALERLDYMMKCVELNDWLNIYSRQFVMGLSYYQALLTNDSMTNVEYEFKGFKQKETADLTLNEQTAREIYNGKKVSTEYSKENIQNLDNIVSLCKQYNCRIIFAVLPESNALTWEFYGWDEFHGWLERYASDNNCELFDINLDKNRNVAFTDDISFSDADHLSAIGARTASELLAEAIKDPTGWKNSAYKSYVEMKKDSQYAYVLEP